MPKLLQSPIITVVTFLAALAALPVNAYGYTYEIVHCGSDASGAGTAAAIARICFVASSSMLDNYGSLFIVDASRHATRYELEQSANDMVPTTVDGAIYDANYPVKDGQVASMLSVHYVNYAGQYIGDGGYEPERLVLTLADGTQLRIDHLIWTSDYPARVSWPDQ